MSLRQQDIFTDTNIFILFEKTVFMHHEIQVKILNYESVKIILRFLRIIKRNIRMTS